MRRFVAYVLPLILLLACGGGVKNVASANQRVVALQHERVWSQGEIELIPEIYSDDFTGHFPGGDVHGYDGIRRRVEAHRAAFPDWTEVVDDWIVENDTVVTRFSSTGTNLGTFLGRPPTNKRVAISEVAISRLEDGRIVEQWVYPDIRTMQDQLYGLQL